MKVLRKFFNLDVVTYLEEIKSLHRKKVGVFKIIRDNYETIYKYKMILMYAMAQQPLKSFDHPQMRVSLSKSILVTLIAY